jgi:hypothetical protein
MKTYSYWLDTLENPIAAPKTELPEQTDLAIVKSTVILIERGDCGRLVLPDIMRDLLRHKPS